ncbi:MAG TPA: hypothetical protein VFW78_05980, partial [Bacteroidia bacterium]|nr:hypothetical protein [Bacteroidia bacterium]
MKKLMIFCVFATLAAPLVAGPGTGTKNTGNVASYTTFKLAPGVTAADIQPGKLIIRLNPSLRMAASQNSIAQPSLESALQAIGCTSLTKKFPQKSEPASAYNRYGQRMVDLSLIYEVSYSSNAPVEKVINCLLRTGMLLYAEPKYLPHLHYTPNDPNLGLQYFLGKIQAYSAWDISTGDTSVVIGITDTGSDLNHPDLVANIKHNYADPINGTDDDGDGYIDNFTGWDLGENDNDPSV